MPDEPVDSKTPTNDKTQADKFFDYILARSRTRESSTLTVATVASSASLILIALFIQAQIDAASCISDCHTECNNKCGNKCDLFQNYDCWIKITGMVFATVGILYREVTIRVIHNADNNFLKEYFSKLADKDTKVNALLNPKRDKAMEVTIRFLLVIPIIIWSFIHGCDFDGFQIDCTISTLGIVGSGIFVILALKEKQ